MLERKKSEIKMTFRIRSIREDKGAITEVGKTKQIMNLVKKTELKILFCIY